MKTSLWAAALVVAGLVLPGRAHADGLLPGRIDLGLHFHLSARGPYSGTQLGPWYLYWPLEAHFQPPAPMAYPYWPLAGAQALPPGFRAPILPPGAPIPKSAAAKPASFQPVGYWGPAPGYWYGR